MGEFADDFLDECLDPYWNGPCDPLDELDLEPPYIEKPMVKFYQVGGCVRDEILGIPSKDIDYSVEAPSYEAMKKEIENRGGQIFLETPEYFTIRAKVPGMGACDFVLCRKDGQYTDGRRPDQVEMGTLYDDLARRDFTMNAIAKDEDGNYIDPFGGRQDISDKLIRCVGDAEKRFSEDYLRILRAIRFSITKDMLLEYNTRQELLALKEHVTSVSVERIREELLKMFKHNTAESMYVLYDFGLDQLLFSKETGLWLKPTLEKL